jgi:hypothetical protein
VLDVAKAVDCEGCQLIDTNYLKKYVIINIMIITKLQFQKNLVFVGRPYRSLLSRKANSLRSYCMISTFICFLIKIPLL